ncbi:hypothetical protein RDABS01_001308 [Bienertia sinuspersici]
MVSPGANTGQMKRLSKNGEEEDRGEEDELEWVIDENSDEDSKASLVLIGKVWAKKRINPRAFMDTMKTLWNPKHGLEARRVDDNLFSFQLYHWRDKAKVRDGQPWHFDRYTICLSDINDDGKPYEFQLHTLPMWVRFYNLPFRGRGNETNAVMLANKVGSFIKADKEGETEIDRSLRLRVAIDVQKPLKDEIKLKLRGGESTKIQVKYERLPQTCFICGCIGHGDRDCDEHNGDTSPLKRLGTWIRASPWKKKEKEEKNEKERTSQCSRRLFVAKPTKVGSKYDEAISGVAERLEAVDLDMSKEDGNKRNPPLTEEEGNIKNQEEKKNTRE